MKLTEEKIKELQKKMTNATSSEEVVTIAKEMGEDVSLEEAAQFLEQLPVDIKPLSDDELKSVSGGVANDDKYSAQYDMIVEYYKQKGPNYAFIMCLYFIPSPLCYEIIEVIEEDVKAGRL